MNTVRDENIRSHKIFLKSIYRGKTTEAENVTHLALKSKSQEKDFWALLMIRVHNSCSHNLPTSFGPHQSVKVDKD